jgi:DNA-binding transcriptional ArsR family regulator
MPVDYDAVAVVQSSPTRQDVLEHLHAEGPAYPTQLAQATDTKLPNVSSALTELRADDLVDLAVDESRSMYRYYELTEAGENVATFLLETVEADGGGRP